MARPDSRGRLSLRGHGDTFDPVGTPLKGEDSLTQTHQQFSRLVLAALRLIVVRRSNDKGL